MMSANPDASYLMAVTESFAISSDQREERIYGVCVVDVATIRIIIGQVSLATGAPFPFFTSLCGSDGKLLVSQMYYNLGGHWEGDLPFHNWYLIVDGLNFILINDETSSALCSPLSELRAVEIMKPSKQLRLESEKVLVRYKRNPPVNKLVLDLEFWDAITLSLK
ncbi:hypothetical protein Ancab_012672 [Ancistrocladus abbreviatus]